MPEKIKCCPACSSSNSYEVVALNSNRKQSYLMFSKVKYNHFIDDWLIEIDIAIDACSDCGHHRYREQPNNEMLFEMYDRGRPLLPQSINNRKEPTSKMVQEMKRLRKITNIVSPKLLDYGSGFGKWARAATKSGFTVTAYEPSRERGIENNDIDFILVHNVASLKNQFFDVINLEQVLEHIPNPLELLKELHVYCKPNTIVRIAVPNILRCPEGKHIWNEWPYDGRRVHTMAPFEHLQGFTPNSLQKIADSAGFSSINSLDAWLQYPIEMLRRYIGKIFPKLGQTFLLLRIKGQN